MHDVTQILSQIESGNPAAVEQLLPMVYDELRKLATAKLARVAHVGKARRSSFIDIPCFISLATTGFQVHKVATDLVFK